MPSPGTIAPAPTPPADLVLARGFLIDPIVEARLRHQLGRAGADVAGVAASTGPLPPGATYRTHAARRTLIDRAAVSRPSHAVVTGALVVRSGLPVEERDGELVVDEGAGRLLVDEGAHAHAAESSGGPIEPASREARPAFPREPVVVLLGLGVDDAEVRWAQDLANALVERQVAATCAVPVDPGGHQLSRPCAPTARSLEALAPDLVVTLDEEAAAVGPRWLHDRHTVVVEAVPDDDLASEVVSWRLGEARGRLRARIGRAVDPGELAALINRLCSGPHPLPPPVSPPTPDTPDDWRQGVATVISSVRPRRRSMTQRFGLGSIVVADGSPGGERSSRDGCDRLHGLADQLVAAGFSARRARVGAPGVDLAQPQLLVLGRATPHPDLVAAVEARRRLGRPTIVDVALDDLDVAAAPPTHPRAAQLGQLAPLVSAAGLVTVPTRGLADALGSLDAAVLVLPTLPTGQLASDGPLEVPPRTRTVVGWQADAVAPDELAGAATGLARVLARQPGLSVEVVGAAADDAVEAVRAQLGTDGDDQLVRGGEPVSAGWRRGLLVHLWTVAPDAVALGGELRPLVEAGFAGVPSVIAAGNPAIVEAAHPRALVVDEPGDPDAWSAVLEPLLDESGWRARAAEAASVASDLWGPEAAALSLNRLLGWLGRSRGVA